MVAKHRTCKVCGEYKEIHHFQPQGYQCRSCRNEKQKIYWASLPEDIRKKRQHNAEYQREYAKRNPERVKELSRAQHLKRKFNITVEEYDSMLKEQNNVCWICSKTCETSYALAVDHDHKTGKIRGLLCKNCNTALGMFKEDIDVIMKAIEYLKIHKESEV